MTTNGATTELTIVEPISTETSIDLTAIENALAETIEAARTPVPPDPNGAGADAANTIQNCIDAASHIREMGATFVKFAQAVKASGDKLADDIERRAEMFAGNMVHAREYAARTMTIFAEERAKLDEIYPSER